MGITVASNNCTWAWAVNTAFPNPGEHVSKDEQKRAKRWLLEYQRDNPRSTLPKFDVYDLEK